MDILVSLVTLNLVVTPPVPCGGVYGDPVKLTREADVIVRVKAREQFDELTESQLRAAPPLSRIFRTSIRFEVLESLKGQSPGRTLSFEGQWSQRDDRNDRPVPYNFVRPEGRGGDCFARRYKQGAEYLLLLRDRGGRLTPYWAPLGPTNEQLFGDDDKWLAWIRQQLRERQPSHD
jgi:hypothetical protein